MVATRLKSWLGINIDRLGIIDRWAAMHRYARNHDLSEPAKYREMKTLLNTALFSDYILVNWFSGTGDWGQGTEERDSYAGKQRDREPDEMKRCFWLRKRSDVVSESRSNPNEVARRHQCDGPSS